MSKSDISSKSAEPLPNPRAFGRSPVTLFAYDTDLELLWVHNAPLSMEPAEFMDAVKEALINGVSRRTVSDAISHVGETGASFFGECDLDVGSESRRFEVTLNFHENNRILGAASDLGGRLPSEAAVRSLSLELAHRTKNLMAVISSLAKQTARRSDRITDFTRKFISQLGALSRAHDVIASTGWRGASLAVVIGTLKSGENPITIDEDGDKGDTILLSPNATQNIAMVLHELSVGCESGGSVRISSQTLESGDLLISWSGECGIPSDQLWTDLLMKVAPLALDGTGEMVMAGSELTYRLTVSSEHFTTL